MCVQRDDDTAANKPPVTYPRIGWTCPVCQRGMAPGVQTCDHGRLMVTNQPHHPGNDGPYRGYSSV